MTISYFMKNLSFRNTGVPGDWDKGFPRSDYNIPLRDH
jgi:hypothetical protein